MGTTLDNIGNPLRKEVRRIAKHHNNGSKRQRFSIDTAKRIWYSHYRMERFNRHMAG